jgi:predicted DNA-binding transcriptional regulator YafY
MNRVDRMLAIVLELQRHGVRRAEDLAATFEISKRTVYRDVEALAESGVPVVSTPGQGYSLIEGFFLPPVAFSKDEATMLLLGADAMRGIFDRGWRAAAESAAAKIEAVLPDAQRIDVRALKAAFRFVSSYAGSNEANDTLLLLRRALIECRVVRFRYHARFADASASEQSRDVDPYALAYVERAWYLSAFDHRHGDVRRFRLDRIMDASLTDAQFIRPNIDTLTTDITPADSRSVEVVAVFAQSAARWVNESRSFFQTASEDSPEGLRVTFRARHEDELLQYLLQWGGAVRVISPPSLRRKLADEARALLSQHAETLLP